MKSNKRKGAVPATVTTPAATGKYVDRNLIAVSPLKEQFEPTASRPIPQHKTMAGAA